MPAACPWCAVPEGSHHYIKRALDAGAWGIVVPMVNTVEQARTAIAAAKFPPEGNRSVGGGMHSMNFDATADEYYRRANDEILVVLQTESPQGLANAPEIYALPGCDAIFIGPNDLQFQMRAPTARFPPPEEHEAAVQQVIAIGKRTRHSHRHPCPRCRDGTQASATRDAVPGDRQRSAHDDGQGPGNRP